MRCTGAPLLAALDSVTPAVVPTDGEVAAGVRLVAGHDLMTTTTERAFDAMMQMTKIDIAAIEAAHRG